MRRIEAIIREEKLDSAKDSLLGLGVRGMTVSEVQGCGDQPGETGAYRGVELEQEFMPRIKAEIIVDEQDLDSVIDAVCQAAHTGEPGDGVIIVTELQRMVHVRTGEVFESLPAAPAQVPVTRALPSAVSARNEMAFQGSY